MNYEIVKQQKEVFKAKKVSKDQKSIIEYEFEKINSGWFIKKRIWSVDTDNPVVSDIYLPDEVVEQILTVETAKNKLNQV